MKVGIAGVGKLGLCVALCLEEVGHDVMGLDIFPEYVGALNNRTFKSPEPEDNDLLKNCKNFKMSLNLKDLLNHSDILLIYIQTPNGGSSSSFYDHSLVSNFLCKVNSEKIKDKHLVIGSTVMPGYIDKIGKYLLEDCENCTLNYSPEFIAQGDIVKGLKYPDTILIGAENDESGKLMKTLYGSMAPTTFFDKYFLMSPLEAEITKISVNGFITTKITYANMIGNLCKSFGDGTVNEHLVCKAIGNDSRIGKKYFNSGLSYGGPCFPRDNLALASVLKKQDLENSIPLLIDDYNKNHNSLIVNRILSKQEPFPEGISEGTDYDYIVRGVCYKPNSSINIIENSSKLEIARELVKREKSVLIVDRPSIILEVKKEFGNMFEYSNEDCYNRSSG